MGEKQTDLTERMLVLESQVGRLVSNAESEKGTHARSNSELRERIEKLRLILDGNGQTGLKIEVALLSQQTEELLKQFAKQDAVEEKRDERERRRDRLLWMAVGGILVLQAVSVFFIKFWKP